MIEALSYTKEQLDYFLEKLSKYKGQKYSETFVNTLNYEYLQREIIRKDKKQQEENEKALAKILKIKDILDEDLEISKNKQIFKQIFSPTYTREIPIKWDREELAKREKSLNKNLWNGFIHYLEHDLFIELDSSYGIDIIMDRSNCFDWLYEIEFSEKEMVENAEKVASIIVQEVNKELLKSLKDVLGDKIEEDTFYGISEYKVGIFYVDWEKKTKIDYLKARRSLAYIYYLSNIGKATDITTAKEVLGIAISTINAAFTNNKRVSIDFCNNVVEFYKTKNTKIKFSKEFVQMYNNFD